jgi:hypothetical protein
MHAGVSHKSLNSTTGMALFCAMEKIQYSVICKMLKNIYKNITTYQGFGNLFSTAQNNAMPAVLPVCHNFQGYLLIHLNITVCTQIKMMNNQ